jgi:hypothetical protein
MGRQCKTVTISMTTGFHQAQQHTHGRCFCATVDRAYNPTVDAIAADGSAGDSPREQTSAEPESDCRASLLAARMGRERIRSRGHQT